jgi:hypothetical protein
MLHFPKMSRKLLAMSKDQKKLFLRDVDLTTEEFEIKIADFGFSKRLKNKN